MSDDQDSQSSDTDSTASRRIDLSPACKMAAGMLHQDLRFLLTVFPILIAPRLITVLTAHPWLPVDLMTSALNLLARVFELTFLYVISRRWLDRLSHERDFPVEIAGYLRFLGIGLAFWLVIVGPTGALRLMSEQVQTIALILLVIGIWIYLKYYFFFFPAVLHERSLQTILKHAAEFTQRDWLLALRCMMAPFAIVVVGSGLFTAISPDGHNLPVVLLANAVHGLFPILTTYLGLAICLHFLGNAEWHRQTLDPYRKARLDTLEVVGPDWLGKILEPKTGVWLLLIGALIWVANIERNMSTPPQASISLASLEISDGFITIELNIDNPESGLSHFIPTAFHLAGKSGTPVSQQWEELLINGEKASLELLGTLAERRSIHLRIRYPIDRKAEQIRALEDVWLWYRAVPLRHLDMKKADSKSSP